MPDYALLRIAREAVLPLRTVRAFYSHRLVSGWASRKIEQAEDRLRRERSPR
jgi:hypothetical protein